MLLHALQRLNMYAFNVPFNVYFYEDRIDLVVCWNSLVFYELQVTIGEASAKMMIANVGKIASYFTTTSNVTSGSAVS